MKIGIIGAGNIGGALGELWAARGHAVVCGVRDANSPKARPTLAESGSSVRIAGVAEAAAFGEVVVIAVPGVAVPDALQHMGDLSGKVIIDTTNWFSGPRPGGAASVTAYIAGRAPGAKVVKCFSTMGWETIRDPHFGGEAATAFVCGDDAGAKATVMGLATELGLDVADAGPLDEAGNVEDVIRFWFALTQNYGRQVAFRLLRR